MLIGEFKHSLDTKGRVIVPSSFRDDFGVRIYCTKGLDKCLFLLSEQEWNKLCEKIRAMPISKSRTLQRFFFAGACALSIDKQGRILFPQTLRNYAGLKKDITIVGVLTRVEIWNSAAWEEINSDFEKDNLKDIMEELDF